MVKGFIRTAVTYEDTPEWQSLWKAARMMALKDGWSMSKLVREALTEYIKRHDPGNPQLALVHWTEDAPMPETLRTKKSGYTYFPKQPSELFEEAVARLNERAKRLDAEKK